MSELVFEEIVLDGIHKLSPILHDKESVFEMGIGVGSVLRVLKQTLQESSTGRPGLRRRFISHRQKNIPRLGRAFSPT